MQLCKTLPDKKALLSAMISLSFFKGFSVCRTITLEETAEWILHLALKIEKKCSTTLPFYSRPAEPLAHTNTTYVEVISKRIKKNNITPDNIGEIMLSQIPNVSCTSATAIMLKYNDMNTLINALHVNPNSLNIITMTNKNGQSKKLSQTCINSIYEFLVKPQIINVSI